MTDTQCKEKVVEHWQRRRADLKEFRDAGPDTDYTNSEGGIPAFMKDAMHLWGELYEYALCFDYVEQVGKNPGYWRYQMSTGGPQEEEIRYYANKAADILAQPRELRRWMDGYPCVEFWLQEQRGLWYDGAGIELTGDDLELVLWVFEMHHEEGN